MNFATRPKQRLCPLRVKSGHGAISWQYPLSAIGGHAQPSSDIGMSIANNLFALRLTMDFKPSRTLGLASKSSDTSMLVVARINAL